MKRDIHIVINKSEITAGTRGASLGPEAMMAAARKEESLLFGQFPIEYTGHMNHLLDKPVKYPHAKRIEGLLQVFSNISDQVSSLLDDKKFPLVIAADHGSAGGTIAGIAKANPGKRLGVIWIDAHGDLHTPYTTPSGNMHGMPLATAISEDNLPCKKNEISHEETAMWQRLKDMSVPGAKLNSEDLVFIAVRDTEPEEDALLERLNIKNHTVDEVRAKGTSQIISEVLDQLSDCDILYISFDVDSMDPEHTSHGTGTPVDNGLTPEEARTFLTAFAKEERTVCMEVVEVNPCLDEKTNKMAEVAFDLFKSLTQALTHGG